jgi:aryl-alcohol dehydrogenase-like predicted oxidoreductase
VRRQPAAPGCDHIDIWYLHRDYNGMDLEEPLRALETLLRAGKIRYWGAVQLPRLAHRRGRAPGTRAEHARRSSASRTTTC